MDVQRRICPAGSNDRREYDDSDINSAFMSRSPKRAADNNKALRKTAHAVCFFGRERSVAESDFSTHAHASVQCCSRKQSSKK